MKTGTSAIQGFLASNIKWLESQGFYYPLINRKAMNYLGFCLLDEIPKHIHHTLDVNKTDLYANLIREIEKAKEDNIILSSEAFSLMSTDRFIGDAMPKFLNEVFKESKYKVKIITFIRRQDEYVESQYNQHIKTHDFWTLCTDSIEQFYKDKKELFNFNTILKKWEKTFGLDAMVIDVYKKDHNSVDQFLSLLGIHEIEQIETKKVLKNKSLSLKALEFMKKANEFNIVKDTASQNNILVELIEASLEQKQKAQLLNHEDRKKIMDEYLVDNEELSKNYLGGNVTWMKNEIPNTEIKKESLTINECIKITTDVWNYFQKKNHE